jgi:antitoxin component of RelBE/YafQ-DinJ toxin-antitoxin module
MSTTTTLTVRLNADIKKAARRRAERLGISLSTLVENDLRRFINGHPIIIDDDSFVPSARLREDIAAAREDEANGDYDDVGPEQLDAYLDKLVKATS